MTERYQYDPDGTAYSQGRRDGAAASRAAFLALLREPGEEMVAVINAARNRIQAGSTPRVGRPTLWQIFEWSPSGAPTEIEHYATIAERDARIEQLRDLAALRALADWMGKNDG